MEEQLCTAPSWEVLIQTNNTFRWGIKADCHPPIRQSRRRRPRRWWWCCVNGCRVDGVERISQIQSTWKMLMQQMKLSQPEIKIMYLQSWEGYFLKCHLYQKRDFLLKIALVLSHTVTFKMLCKSARHPCYHFFFSSVSGMAPGILVWVRRPVRIQTETPSLRDRDGVVVYCLYMLSVTYYIHIYFWLSQQQEVAVIRLLTLNFVDVWEPVQTSSCF